MRRQTRLTILLFCLLALASVERAWGTIEINVGCTSALTGPSAFGVGHLFNASQKAAPVDAADCEMETPSTDDLTLEVVRPERIEKSFFFPISVPAPTPAYESPEEAVPSLRILLLSPATNGSK